MWGTLLAANRRFIPSRAPQSLSMSALFRSHLCHLFESSSRYAALTSCSRGLMLLASLSSHLVQRSNSEVAAKKSKNEKKREFRRAVRWGMDISRFSLPQIKRVLRVASLGRDVFDAFMLVKRLSWDVRQGRRRQFNYIGRLLMCVQPDMMEAVIQAHKDGNDANDSSLENLVNKETLDVKRNEAEDWESEIEDEEVSPACMDLARRWYRGLIEGEAAFSREVYSIYNAEFDRQELRKLVREVRLLQDASCKSAAIADAEKSLLSFLQRLAKHTIAAEGSHEELC